MTLSPRAHVHRMLLDPDTFSLSSVLRELVVLAEDLGDTATAAWARQELDGHPATGPVPDYRRITAPIIGVTMKHGAPVLHQVSLADIPDGHRNEITRLDAELGVRHGVAVLERQRGQFTARPDPVERPGLPHLPELLRLMSDRTFGVTFVTFYWDIGRDGVDGVLAAIRTAAEDRLRDLPTPVAAPAGTSETRKQTNWTIISAVVGILALIATIVIAMVAG